VEMLAGVKHDLVGHLCRPDNRDTTNEHG
jgi:hypothetical protein